MIATDRFKVGMEVKLKKNAINTRKKGWQDKRTIDNYSKAKVLIVEDFHSAVDEAIKIRQANSHNSAYFHFMDIIPLTLTKKVKPKIIHFDTTYLNI